jgi:site-specific recombinase XerD
MATNSVANQNRKDRSSKSHGLEGPHSDSRRSFKTLNVKMAERFRAWLGAQRYSPSTQERYHRIACKLCHFIGRKPLASVTPMDIGDFLTQTLPDRWQDSYISDHLGPLRSFFDFLYLGGVVDSVAPRFLKARARSKPLPRALTEAQIRKLIRGASHPRDRALIELLYATGCRIGEIRLARIEDIDFRKRRFLVRGKRKERMVYFGARAAKCLRVYLRGRRSGYLFQDKIEPQRGYVTRTKTTWLGIWRDYTTGKKGGVRHTKRLGNRSVVTHEEAERRLRGFLRDKNIDLLRYRKDIPLNRSSLSFVVRAIGRKLGIPRVSPHALRHSFATHLLERGADIRAVQELLGHTYLTSTQVYTRISNRAVRSAFKKFHPRG